MNDYKRKICDKHKSLGKVKYGKVILDIRYIGDYGGDDYVFFKTNICGGLYHSLRLREGRYIDYYGHKIFINHLL